MEKKYDIFISYSRANLDEVKAIKAEIEQQTGACCWMDLQGIESGIPRFTKAIIEGIDACGVLLFMRSAHSQESEFALRELNYASRKQKHVVIVNIDKSPMTDEFLFLYGLTDTIDWRNIPQREKLMRDIRKWTGKSPAIGKTQETAVKRPVASAPKSQDSGAEIHVYADADCQVFRFSECLGTISSIGAFQWP